MILRILVKKNYDLKKMLLDSNSLNLEYSLFYLICYAIRYDKNKKTDHCSDDILKNKLVIFYIQNLMKIEKK